MVARTVESGAAAGTWSWFPHASCISCICRTTLPRRCNNAQPTWVCSLWAGALCSLSWTAATPWRALPIKDWQKVRKLLPLADSRRSEQRPGQRPRQLLLQRPRCDSSPLATWTIASGRHWEHKTGAGGRRLWRLGVFVWAGRIVTSSHRSGGKSRMILDWSNLSVEVSCADVAVAFVCKLESIKNW